MREIIFLSIGFLGVTAIWSIFLFFCCRFKWLTINYSNYEIPRSNREGLNANAASPDLYDPRFPALCNYPFPPLTNGVSGMPIALPVTYNSLNSNGLNEKAYMRQLPRSDSVNSLFNNVDENRIVPAGTLVPMTSYRTPISGVELNSRRVYNRGRSQSENSVFPNMLNSCRRGPWGFPQPPYNLRGHLPNVRNMPSLLPFQHNLRDMQGKFNESSLSIVPPITSKQLYNQHNLQKSPYCEQRDIFGNFVENLPQDTQKQPAQWNGKQTKMLKGVLKKPKPYLKQENSDDKNASNSHRLSSLP